MKSTALWALIVLNAALLISFAWRLFPDNTAHAQQAAAVRRAGDYLLIPIEVSGATTGIVVVVDQTTAQLGAMSFEDSTGRLENMEKVDLRRVFQGTPAPAPRGGAR